MARVPRYAPSRALPTYAWLPGGSLPHPRRHPDGHSQGLAEPRPEPLDPAAFQACEAYLAAVDLYNAGFHWEAHELLEALWNAAGRSGAVAELLQGLVKLAAAGVKQRQGNLAGVRKHAERAAAHFERVMTAAGAKRFAGLDLAALCRDARELAKRAAEGVGAAEAPLPVWRLSPWPPRR